jgi:hypothetical protein
MPTGKNSVTKVLLKLSKNKNSPQKEAIFATNRIGLAISARPRFAYYIILRKRKVKNFLIIF